MNFLDYFFYMDNKMNLTPKNFCYNIEKALNNFDYSPNNFDYYTVFVDFYVMYIF